MPFVQGTYYLLIGLWPLLALDSLLPGSTAESEPVQLRAFGGVVAVVGALLLIAARRRGSFIETARMGVAVALALAATDVMFVLKGIAPAIYLVDAAVQVAFVCWWGRALIPHDPEPVGTLRTGLV